MNAKQRNIRSPLEEMTRKAYGRKSGVAVTDREVFDRFMVSDIRLKGACQSYVYEKGGRGTVGVKVNVLELALAIAGVPPPSFIIADVGGNLSVEVCGNHLVVAHIAPGELRADSVWLTTSRRIAFLAMTGVKFESKVGVSAELGFKTPDIPGVPKLAGGGLKETGQVEKGTYAELCAFEIGAKASAKAEAGFTGQYLSVSDSWPTFYSSHGELQSVFKDTLAVGNKKTVIKNDILRFFKENPELRKYTPTRSWLKKYITHGNISTDSYLASLDKARKDLQARKQLRRPELISNLNHYTHVLESFRDTSRMTPYCSLSLLSMKPEGSAGVSAEASASVSLNVGVAGADTTNTVVVKGPGVSTHLKSTWYRFQVSYQASVKSAPKPPAKRSGQETGTTALPYMVLTQDTQITYGSIDLTLLGAEINIGAGVRQTVVPDKKYQKSFGNLDTKDDSRRVKDHFRGELKLGAEETSLRAKAEGRLHKAYNYMFYTSACVYWIPPLDAGTDKEQRQVRLAPGSGFAFGQSVAFDTLKTYVKSYIEGGKVLKGGLEGMANAIRVPHQRFKTFLDSEVVSGETLADFILMMDDQGLEAEAFLIESTYEAPSDVTLDVRWKKGRWMLTGTGKVVKSLRSLMISKKRPLDVRKLQSIRLRYRVADKKDNTRTKFKLGFSFIVSAEVEIESVERAGAEGIVDLFTCWFGSLATGNLGTDPLATNDKAVPPVALFHQ